MRGLVAALAGYEGVLVGYERPAQVVAGGRKKVREAMKGQGGARGWKKRPVGAFAKYRRAREVQPGACGAPKGTRGFGWGACGAQGLAAWSWRGRVGSAEGRRHFHEK